MSKKPRSDQADPGQEAARPLFAYLRGAGLLDAALPMLAAYRERNPRVPLRLMCNELRAGSLIGRSETLPAALRRLDIQVLDRLDFLRRLRWLRPLARRFPALRRPDTLPPEVAIRQRTRFRLRNLQLYTDYLLNYFIEHRFDIFDRFPDSLLLMGASETFPIHLDYLIRKRRAGLALPDSLLPVTEPVAGDKVDEVRLRYVTAGGARAGDEESSGPAGHPATDGWWLERAGQLFPSPTTADAALRCVVLLRPFAGLLSGRRPEEEGAGPSTGLVLGSKEMGSWCRSIDEALSATGRAWSVTVIPHHENNLETLPLSLAEAGVPRWSVSREPIWAQLSRPALFVALDPQAGVYPALAGLPVVFPDARLEQQFQALPNLRDRLRRLRFSASDPRKLSGAIAAAAEQVAGFDRAGGPSSSDAVELRGIFPDGAIARGLGLLESARSLV